MATFPMSNIRKASILRYDKHRINANVKDYTDKTVILDDLCNRKLARRDQSNEDPCVYELLLKLVPKG